MLKQKDLHILESLFIIELKPIINRQTDDLVRTLLETQFGHFFYGGGGICMSLTKNNPNILFCFLRRVPEYLSNSPVQASDISCVETFISTQNMVYEYFFKSLTKLVTKYVLLFLALNEILRHLFPQYTVYTVYKYFYNSLN